MKYYDTYTEAKAAYPDCDAVLTTGTKWGGSSEFAGKFCPVYTSIVGKYKWTDCEMAGDSFPQIGETIWTIATPPKTRTTYEKVEFEYAWQALKMHTEEGLYTTGYEDGEYVEFINPADVVGCYEFGSLYQEVEKEIDWRDEVRSYLNSDRATPDKETRWINVNFGEGYALSDSEFLEMCRTALRATGELPE